MFDQRFLDELIARSDIVDVVSGYVALQRKGGNLFGLCPFHNEKTPSFYRCRRTTARRTARTGCAAVCWS